MPSEDYISKIKKLLIEDRIKESINELLILFKKKDAQDELIIHLAVIARIENAFNKGLIDWDKVSQSRNRIIAAILDILKEIQGENSGISIQSEESELAIKLNELDKLLVRKPASAPKPTDHFDYSFLLNAAAKISSELLQVQMLKTYAGTYRASHFLIV